MNMDLFLKLGHFLILIYKRIAQKTDICTNYNICIYVVSLGDSLEFNPFSVIHSSVSEVC